MVGTKMGHKLFVAPHHIEIFIQCLVGKKVGGLEDPCAFGTSPLLSFVIPDKLATYRHMDWPRDPTDSPHRAVPFSFLFGSNVSHPDAKAPILQDEGRSLTGL